MPRARTTLRLVIAVLLTAITGGMPARAAELVMFEKDGCPWCLRWHQEIGKGYPLSDEGKLAPLRVLKGTDPKAVGASLKAPVTHAPTFVLVDKGQEVGRIVGYPGADFFYGLLVELLQKRDRQSVLERRRQPHLHKSPS